MGKRRGSLNYQINEKMKSMFSPGESRYKGKETGEAKNKIYSYNTFETYKKSVSQFTSWGKERFSWRNIEDIKKEHAIQFLKEKGGSAWSLQTHKSAFNKVFGFDIKRQEANIPLRQKKNITRSREIKKMDSKVKLDKYSNQILIAQSFGIRRESMKKITFNDFKRDSEGVLRLTVKEKGGRIRESRVLPSRENEVLSFLKTVENKEGALFDKYSKDIDNHAFRGDYATNLYTELLAEKGYSEGDYRGFDREIIKEVSGNLGHSRLDVVVNHYLKF